MRQLAAVVLAVFAAAAPASGTHVEVVLDVVASWVALFTVPVWIPLWTCAVCITGDVVVLADFGEEPDGNPDYFPPGAFHFGGPFYADDGDQRYPGCETGSVGDIVLAPIDGRLDAPVLVWRDYHDGIDVLRPPTLETIPAGAPDFRLRTECEFSQHFWSPDLLVWPTGNVAEPMRVQVEAAIVVGDVSLRGVDADHYEAWLG